MTVSRIRETDRFEAKGPSGRIYTITERTEQIEVTTAADKVRRWEDSMKSYVVSSGGNVNQIDDSTFFIVSTGETVKRL